MGHVALSDLFKGCRASQRSIDGNGDREVTFSEAIRKACETLVEVKATQAPNLHTVDARQALFHAIDTLQYLLVAIPDALTVHTWVEHPKSDGGQQAAATVRIKQISVLRAIQVMLILSILLLAVYESSLVAILFAALLLPAIAAEIAILDLDPLKGARESWLRNILGERMPRILRWLFFGSPRKPAPQHETGAIACAQIAVDERQVNKFIMDYLDRQDAAITQIDAERRHPGDPLPYLPDKLLHFLQALSGGLVRDDEPDMIQTLKIELPQICAALGIDVIEWRPDAPPELWDMRQSTTIDKPTIVLPAMTLGDRIVRGVVYHPRQ